MILKKLHLWLLNTFFDISKLQFYAKFVTFISQF